MRLVIACYSGRESESGAKGTLSLSLSCAACIGYSRSRFGIERNSFMLLYYTTEWGPPSTTTKRNYCSTCDYDEGKLT